MIWNEIGFPGSQKVYEAEKYIKFGDKEANSLEYRP